MLKWIVVFLVTFIIFMVVDVMWLGLFAKKFYRKHLGFIMSDKFNLPVAAAFYFVFIIGLLFFVVSPAIKDQSFVHALFGGMLFGLITYGTYDLTNMATLKNWPKLITIVDLIWGSSLCGVVSMVSYLLFKTYI
ncbi:MAG: DUF2177 family protein [Clostridia bacterium]|nr:DUF2177 family protein [Clostridia bacterium]